MPDLECLVGLDSVTLTELYMVSQVITLRHYVEASPLQVKCSEAWNISIKYDRAIANSFAGANYISEHDRRLRTIK